MILLIASALFALYTPSHMSPRVRRLSPILRGDFIVYDYIGISISEYIIEARKISSYRKKYIEYLFFYVGVWTIVRTIRYMMRILDTVG